MNLRFRTVRLVIFLCLLASPFSIFAAEPGSDLAGKLRAKQEGSTFVRVRMQTASGEKQTLQVQIKSRASGDTADIVYQILFPKERKGESVLLHRSAEKLDGTLFAPPNSLRPIASSQLNQSLFGTELSYEDIADNPYGWSQQSIVGTESIDGNACQILESKPPKGRNSTYSSVKTWVDPRRLVPLRIEKYDSTGKVLRRINTTRVLLDGNDSLPADLKVYGPNGGATEITGSRIKRNMTYADNEFTPEGLKQLTIPPGSAE